MALGFFLLKIYKNKKENSSAIATPGRTIILNNEERNENISNPENNELPTLYYNKSLPVPKEMVNSNQGQESMQDYEDKSTNPEVIQNLRQGYESHNISNDGQSNSFGINKEIVDHIKQ